MTLGPTLQCGHAWTVGWNRRAPIFASFTGTITPYSTCIVCPDTEVEYSVTFVVYSEIVGRPYFTLQRFRPPDELIPIRNLSE